MLRSITYSLNLCRCFCLWSATLTLAQASDGVPSAIEEANLRAISFIDVDRGWVAGERGVILSTQDGGLTWKSQSTSSTTCFVDIAMYNSQRGLAIGGMTEPYTGISVGDVVITKDGGQSWTQVVGHNLPRLRKMVIGLGGKCVAVGDWSPVHLSALFTSADGGATWKPETCDIVGAIVDIAGGVDDFLVVSDQGAVVRFRQNAAPNTLFEPTQSKYLYATDQQISSQANVWQEVAARDDRRILAGPQGMIVSDDRGDTWKVMPKFENQQQSQNQFDFNTAHATDHSSIELWQDDVWLAKDTSPRITLLPSSLNQANLASASLPLPVEHNGGSSIRTMLRLDRDRGWAVGDFGMILATRDGGHTWRTLRGGNRWPALMVVGSNPVEMPWSILATESLQHQRRVSLTIDEVSNRKVRPLREQLIETTSLLGPATVYSLQSNGAQIADLLRFANPAVLILDSSLPSERRAAWAAAALQSGCKRVIEINARGSQTVNVSAAIPAAGILASDIWLDAASRLSPGFSIPTRLMLNTRYDATRNALATNGLASCIHNSPQYCWSRSSTPSRRQLQVLQARTTEMNWVESLISPSTGVVEFRSQLDLMLPRMNAQDQTRLFSKLLSLVAQRERSDLHIALLEKIASQAKNPKDLSSDLSNLSKVSSLRLEAIRSSVEWRRLMGVIAASNDTRLTADAQVKSASNADLSVRLSPFQSQTTNDKSPISTVGAFNFSGSNPGLASNVVQLAIAETDNGATRQSTNTAVVDLRWEFHPAVLMVNRIKEHQANILLTLTESTTEPMRDGANSSATNLRRIAGISSAGRWGLLANDLISSQTVSCAVADTPPHLDGAIDESWWHSGQIFSIENGTASLQMAHDDEFVYVGINAPALSPTNVLSEERTRDTSFDGSDRYRIRLDLDRDLMTSYEFEFDLSGNTRDRCDGFPEFDPRWFIACVEKDGRTHVELAIQKSDLGAELANHQSIWNVSVDHFRRANPNPGLSMPNPQEWLPVYLE